MSRTSNFGEYYKTISDSELINILDNPGQYQPVALEAAKLEFSSRQLSDDAIADARKPLIDEKLRKETAKEKREAIESKINVVAIPFLDTINPIQSGLPTTEKTMRLIVIVFGALFLYQMISEVSLHILVLQEFKLFPGLALLYFTPFLLLGVGVIGFWKRKKIGWIFLTIYLTFSALIALFTPIQSFVILSSYPGDIGNFYPASGILKLVIQLLFLVGSIVLLCKANIRKVFSVDRPLMWATIGMTIAVAITLYFSNIM